MLRTKLFISASLYELMSSVCRVNGLYLSIFSACKINGTIVEPAYTIITDIPGLPVESPARKYTAVIKNIYIALHTEENTISLIINSLL